MNSPKRIGMALLVTGAMTLPVVASAQRAYVERDQVVPIVMDDELTIAHSRPGDTFAAHVANDRDLPYGTRFYGHVVRVRESRSHAAGSMDLQFDEIEMPDGARTHIDAVPVLLDDRYIHRDRDGHFVVYEDDRKKNSLILGGALGGFAIGSMSHHRILGTVLGAIIGAVAAESDKSNDGNTIVWRGEPLGALFNTDFRPEWDDRRDRDRDRDRDSDWDRRPDRNPWRTRDDGPWARDIQVRSGDHVLRYRASERPFRREGVTMVPLDATADQLGLHVDYDRDSREDVRIASDRGEIRLRRGRTEAELNRDWITLPAPMIEREGVIFVPVEALAQISGENLYVNGTRISGRGF